jgi:GT2 family glycosyltransferase
VIVDNNCTDDTVKVIEEACNTTLVPLRRVVETRQGLSNARNRGITEAQGRYLIFTDDDTRPLPHWVNAIWQTFEQEHCDGVAGRVELDWPMARPKWLVDDLLSSLAHADYGPLLRRLSSPEEPPLGANMAFSRAVFENVGNFDPNLGRIGSKLLGGEETDLYKRAIDAGFNILYQPAAVMLHAVEAERLDKTYFRKLYYYGGRVCGAHLKKSNSRRVFGVPTYGVRKLLVVTSNFVADALHQDIDLLFKNELNIWWHWGFVTGCFISNWSYRN